MQPTPQRFTARYDFFPWFFDQLPVCAVESAEQGAVVGDLSGYLIVRIWRPTRDLF